MQRSIVTICLTCDFFSSTSHPGFEIKTTGTPPPSRWKQVFATCTPHATLLLSKKSRISFRHFSLLSVEKDITFFKGLLMSTHHYTNIFKHVSSWGWHMVNWKTQFVNRKIKKIKNWILKKVPPKFDEGLKKTFSVFKRFRFLTS